MSKRVVIVGSSGAADLAVLAGQSLGLRIDRARNADQARHALTAGAFALAIIDTASTDLDGASLIEANRGTLQGTPVLVLAETLETQFVARLVRAGVSYFALAASAEAELRDKLIGLLGVDASPACPRAGEPVSIACTGGTATRAAQSQFPVRALIVMPPAPTKLLQAALAKHRIEAHKPRCANQNPFELLQTDARFAVLIAALQHLDRAARARLVDLIFENPTLKVVVTAANRSDPDIEVLRLHGVTAIFHEPTDPERIAGAAGDLLSEHHYDESVASCIAESVPAVLAAINAGIRAFPPILRVSAKVLGPLSAMIEIGGGVVGRVLVSGNQHLFQRIAKDWRGERPRTKDQVWDATGEIANHVAASVRKHYLSRGLESTQSTPTIIEGERVELRYGSKKPGLVVPFSIDRFDGELFVELILSDKQPDGSDPAAEVGMTETEIEFF